MPFEEKVNACAPVRFAAASLKAVLPGYAGRLLCRVILDRIIEKIDAREPHLAVAPHGFAKGCCLRVESGFLHHVAVEQEVVSATPVAELVHVRGDKPLAHMVVEPVSCKAGTAAREIPD